MLAKYWINSTTMNLWICNLQLLLLHEVVLQQKPSLNQTVTAERWDYYELQYFLLRRLIAIKCTSWNKFKWTHLEHNWCCWEMDTWVHWTGLRGYVLQKWMGTTAIRYITISNHGITHDFLKSSIRSSLGMAACHLGSVSSNLFDPKRLNMGAAELRP